MIRHHALITIIILLCLLTQPCRADVTDGLIGWWRMDEAASGTCTTTITDSSSSGSTGTCNNSPVWTNGKVGTGALIFTPVSSGVQGSASPYIDVSNESKYDNLPKMSWSGWYYETTSYPNTSIIMEKSNAWRIMCIGGFVSGAIATSNNGWYSAGTTLGGGVGSMNAWHHFVFTYDGSNSREYLDGILTSTSSPSISGNIARASGVHVRIGFSDAANTTFFSGSLDDIRIYKRTLTAAEVKAIYYTGAPYHSTLSKGRISKGKFNF